MTVDELKVVIKAETKQFKTDISKCKEELKNTAEQAKETGKQTSSFGKEFNQFLGKIAVAKVFFDLILKVIRAIVSTIKSGITSLANFDAEFANDWATFKASVAQLKDALGAAFAPLFKLVVPVLTKITQMTTELTNQLGKMFAKISGSSSWVQASKDVDDYTEAVQKANKSLLGFDELNQLKSTDTTSSNLIQTEIEVEDTGLSNVLNKITDLLKPVISLVESLLDPIASIVVALIPLVDMVADLLNTIIKPIAELITKIVNSLLPAIVAIINTVSTILKPIFNLVSNIITTIIDNIPVSFFEALNQLITQILDVITLILEPVLTIIEILTPVISGVLGGAVKEITRALTLVLQLLSPVLSVLQIIGTVSSALFKTFVAILTLDFKSIGSIWEDVGSKISGVWKSIKENAVKAFDSIKATFKAVINGMIDIVNGWIKGLNILLAPLRAIVYGVAKAFGTNINFSQVAIPTIPKLAKGGVIDSPTIAMLGEYNNAKNNPEIAAPESTIRAIMNEGNEDLISTFIQVGRQLMATIENKDLTVNIGDDSIANAAARGNRSYYNRTGTNLIGV